MTLVTPESGMAARSAGAGAEQQDADRGQGGAEQDPRRRHDQVISGHTPA
ncbi:MAG TPA: hypothetical protein VG123_01980 [Streptosporangiaceae bacterium]|jgi:hypothetical protein|nr:hypothetical protein [Streptosporangiaceae bacterium]